MNPWLREDTKQWISILEHRIDDMSYYKQQALDWCQERGISDQTLLSKCLITTCIWVAHMRQEELTVGEIFDLIGVKNLDETSSDLIDYDNILTFKEGAGDVELEELLIEVLKG